MESPRRDTPARYCRHSPGRLKNVRGEYDFRQGSRGTSINEMIKISDATERSHTGFFSDATSLNHKLNFNKQKRRYYVTDQKKF